MLVPFILAEDALTGSVDHKILLKNIRHVGAYYSRGSTIKDTDLPDLVEKIPRDDKKKMWHLALRNNDIRAFACSEAPPHITTPPSLTDTDLPGCKLLFLGEGTGAAFKLSSKNERCNRGELELVLATCIGESKKMATAGEAAAKGKLLKDTLWETIWSESFAPILTNASNIQVFDRHAGGRNILKDTKSSLFRLIRGTFAICESPHIEIYTTMGDIGNYTPKALLKYISEIDNTLSGWEKGMSNLKGKAKVDIYAIPQWEMEHPRGILIDEHWKFGLDCGIESLQGKKASQNNECRYNYLTIEEMKKERELLKRYRLSAETGHGNSKQGYWKRSLKLGRESFKT